MKHTRDFSTIITVCILILFILFTILYVLKNNSTKEITSLNNYVSNIYSEHNHIMSKSKKQDDKTQEKAYERKSQYTTKIYDTETNRIYNIKLACEKLDGHIVAPGEEFSFNNVMGKMGNEDGYKKATGFDSNGKKIKMYGGGICQISSTLYNAVLASDLKVTERHAHSRRVYYVPKNKDATVYYGGPDFKFINTYDSNIMICIATDGYTVTVSLKQEKTNKI